MHLIVGSPEYQLMMEVEPMITDAFVQSGVAAFTVSIVAPAFLSDLARAQGGVEPQPRRARI